MSVTLQGWRSLCTDENRIEWVVVHWRTFVWQSRIMVVRLDPSWAGGEREGPPASCPGFVYNKKPLFDVVAQTAPKLPLPQDVLWVKCQTEATAGWLRTRHTGTLSKVLLRPLETEKYIKQQQFDTFCFVSSKGDTCGEYLSFCLPIKLRWSKGNNISCEKLIL